jgi:hypothetical protein
MHAVQTLNRVAAYEILPLSLVGVASSVLPWCEIATGLVLVLGPRRPSSIGPAILMLVVFVSAQVIAIGRGLRIECGCFSGIEQTIGMATLTRAVAMLIAFGGLAYGERWCCRRASEPDWHREGEVVTS